MNETNATLRLLILVQMFMLFALLLVPLLIRHLQEPWGKAVYALLAAGCVAQALRLRRAFQQHP